jgi:very-short-patch-repair endonuclease
MSFADVLDEHDQVLDAATALEHMTYAELRWKVWSGRWQKPARGIFVAHSGELTERQVMRVATLWGGARSVIGGLSAAWLGGFTGFGDRKPIGERPVFLLVPHGWNRRAVVDGVRIVPRFSRTLSAVDVHPAGEPKRTRIGRSLIDAAQWMATDRGAMAVLAAGVQQRLVRVTDLSAVLARSPRLHRGRLITGTLDDIAGGAQALSELDFTRKVVRRHRLPEPDRQMGRRDKQGRQRWIDVAWDEWKVLVEIDGAQHMDALEYWNDMDRGNEFTIEGYRLLRFPAWVVRLHPDLVARKIRDALRKAGCRCLRGHGRAMSSPCRMESQPSGACAQACQAAAIWSSLPGVA